MKPAQGQTMVLFALTMLLMVLMVCMTLSFSMKVREKIEVQTVADTAAYSNAVVTARAFNQISLMNRVQVAHMVALAGTESLISYAALYRGYLNAADSAYANPIQKTYDDIAKINCPCAPFNGLCAKLCKCGRKGGKDVRGLRSKLAAEQSRVDGLWGAADQAANKDAQNQQTYAALLYTNELATYVQLESEIRGQRLANKIVRIASRGSPWAREWSAPGSGDSISTREIDPFLGAVWPKAIGTTLLEVYAAMGSRGDPFVTGRQGSDGPINAQLAKVISGPDSVRVNGGKGSTYFSDTFGHGIAGNTPSGKFAWAEDHGQITSSYNHLANGGDPLCPAFMSKTENADARVFSTDLNDTSDEHRWTGGADSSPPASKANTLGWCNPAFGCPGIWPSFVDYNPLFVMDASDNFAQPKNIAVVQRDYRVRGVRADPWNMLFNFKPVIGGAGVNFNNNGMVLQDGAGPNISRQVALATGIAYYHRGRTGKSHWKEPPNFLNPFWRATLVANDTDKQGRKDPRKVLNDIGQGTYANVYDQLVNREGYKGLH